MPPLLVSAWRASPHGRFGLFGPLVPLLGSTFLFLLALGLNALPDAFVAYLFFPLFFVQPLITALLLMWVSREARALSPPASTHRRLSFFVMSGMVLALLSELLLLGSGMLPYIVLPVICAVIVAIFTLFGLSRSRESTQARPKDASPSEVDSRGES